jgi:hypothetical protein
VKRLIHAREVSDLRALDCAAMSCDRRAGRAR